MRLQIGRGFGIPIYLHWTFLFLPLWILWVQPDDSPFSLPVVFTVMALSFVCIVLHEFGHILMARRFGIGTEDVTLYPIGGVARLRKMTEKPLEEFLIAVAGPSVNVVIAVVLLLVLAPMAYSDIALRATNLLSSFGGQVTIGLCLFNIVMVPFNMLPVFPMDGGRVLRALLSSWLGLYKGTRIAAGIGVVMAILIGIAGAASGNMLVPILALFVIIAGQQELMMIRLREQQRQMREQLPEALPVTPRVHVTPAPQQPMLMFQPKISVYTWDNQTGTWRQE